MTQGVNVNVTLLFGITCYRAAAEAYLSALEDRLMSHAPLPRLASVASFFIRRIDTWIDTRLDALGTPAATALRGCAAIACARLAYQEFRRLLDTPRWRVLAARGARTQRLLWASASTKDRTCRDVRYVGALIGADTLNAMPMEAVPAFREHGEQALRLEIDLNAADALHRRLAALGIQLDDAAQTLEDDGIRKFITPYDRLLATPARQRSAQRRSAP